MAKNRTDIHRERKVKKRTKKRKNKKRLKEILMKEKKK